MAKASDNEFPSVLLKEGTVPASPAAGDQRLYIDSTDHLVKRVNSSGTVTTVEGGAATLVKSTSAAITANWTLTAANAWTSVPGLSYTYTPTVNETFVLTATALLSFAGSLSAFSRVTISPAPTGNWTDNFQTYHESVVSGQHAQEFIVLSGNLTASTAYTFTFQVYGTTTSVTVNGSTGANHSNSVLSMITLPR